MENLLNGFSVGLFFWQSVLFIILLVILKKYAWGPILNSVEEREEGIRSAIDEAKAAKEEMAQLKASNEDLLKEARIEREAMLQEARAIKDKIVGDASNTAKEEAAQIITAAKATIESEKQKAMVEIKNQVAELSIEVASLILKENLSSDAKQSELAEKYVKELNLN
jgi:F-type H+-transporting ATPase subunit b